MVNGVPVLIYYPKELIKDVDELIKRGKYMSRSEMIRSATRLVIEEQKSEALRETREIRRRIEKEYLKKADGDRNKAIDMFFDDVMERQEKDPFYNQ